MEGKPLDEQYSWEACDRWSSREDYQWKMKTLRLKKVIKCLCLAYFCLLFFKWMTKPSSKKKSTWASHRRYVSFYLSSDTPFFGKSFQPSDVMCVMFMCVVSLKSRGAHRKSQHFPITSIIQNHSQELQKIVSSLLFLFHIFQSRRDFLWQTQNEESILSLFCVISQTCTVNLSTVTSHTGRFTCFLFSLLWWGMSLWGQSGAGGVIFQLLPILLS